jgi:hypothetical protein
MKLIEPIKNLGSLSTSDAPADELAEWAPTGRDLLRYLEKPVFDIVGNTMAIASSTVGGSVYSVDLATGDVTTIGYSASGAVRNIVLSPDKSYCYISFMNGSGKVSYEVFNTLSGSVEYSSAAITQTANVVAGDVRNDCQWLPDSSRCYFASNDKIYYLSVSGWTISQRSIGSSNQTFTTVEIISNEVFTTSSQYVSRLDLDLNISLEDLRSPGFTNFSTAYNATNGDLLALNSFGGVRLINKNTLVLSSVSALSGSFFNGAKSFISTSSHLITRSQSTAPYWNYRLLTDYSLDKSLPTLPDPGEIISVGTNYTVVQQDDGIETLLSADDSIIAQTNPSVIAGDTFIYQNNIYEALLDNSSQPDTGSTSDPATWLDRGVINSLRMFDGKLESLTTSDNALTVQITPNQLISGIALLNLDTKTIRVTMTDPVDGLVYDSGEISMIDNSAITDWFAFYNAAYIKKSDFVSLALPPYPNAVTEVTIDGGTSPISIGQIVSGRTFSLGDTQFGTSVGILDFSEKQQDQFGNFTILERKFVKRADFDVKMPTNSVSGAQRTLARFRATPAVWVGDESREETIIYGYYKSFDIVIGNPALSDTSILVEGL